MTQEPGPTYVNMPASGWTTEGSHDRIRLRGGNSTSERLEQSDSESRTDEDEDLSIDDLPRLADGMRDSQTNYMRQPTQLGTVVDFPGAAHNARGMRIKFIMNQWINFNYELGISTAMGILNFKE